MTPVSQPTMLPPHSPATTMATRVFYIEIVSFILPQSENAYVLMYIDAKPVDILLFKFLNTSFACQVINTIHRFIYVLLFCFIIFNIRRGRPICIILFWSPRPKDLI